MRAGEGRRGACVMSSEHIVYHSGIAIMVGGDVALLMCG